MSDNAKDEELNFDAESELSWRIYLADFNNKVWPAFRELGYSKDTTLLAWLINKQYNLTCDLIDLIREENGRAES